MLGRRRRRPPDIPALPRAVGAARPVAGRHPGDRQNGGWLLLPVQDLGRHGAVIHVSTTGPLWVRPGDLADLVAVGLRGVAELTVLLAGELEHRDALGNRGTLQAPAVLLVAGGGGILTETGPSRSLRRDGGDLHVVVVRWLQGAVAVPTVRQAEGEATWSQGRSLLSTWCGPDGMVQSPDGVVVHTVRVAVGAVIDLDVGDVTAVVVIVLTGRVLVGPDLDLVAVGEVVVLGLGGRRLQLATGLADDEAPLVLVIAAGAQGDLVVDRDGTLAAADEEELTQVREQARSGAFGTLPGLDG